MKVEFADDPYLPVASVHGLDAARITDQQADDLKALIYANKIVMLKDQQLSAGQYLDFTRRLGVPEAYYQPMYHHPEFKEIFVSSNVPKEGVQVGVPKTGRFWHADYAFMPRPFAFTVLYPQIIPPSNRGTYFVNMGEAYNRLPETTKQKIEDARCSHSVLRYFKIRPEDVYRPISEIIDEVHQHTPDVKHPCCITHPITGERILYVSDGFTNGIEGRNGEDLGTELLDELLIHSGQRDGSFRHPLIRLQFHSQGDVILFDNRSLVHCALHTDRPEPAEAYRITLHDGNPFSGEGARNAA